MIELHKDANATDDKMDHFNKMLSVEELADKKKYILIKNILIKVVVKQTCVIKF